MKSRNFLITLAVIVFVAAVAWYFASPAYALSQLKEAAQTGDRDDLEERIDFPKVKESLKSQLSARMMKEVEKSKDDKDNPFGAMGAMFAMAMINPMIDGIVTPDGMAALIQQGRIGKVHNSTAQAQSEEAEWSVERDGLDKFRALVKKGEADKPVALVFKRDGLGWKLVEIALPEDLPTND